MLRTRYRGRFEEQVFDIAGSGRIDASLQTPPSPGVTAANTNRDERSTEWFVRDAMRLAAHWQFWAGLRHTRLQRESERTSPDSNGLHATQYGHDATLPWLALAHEISTRTLLYASWGEGLESEVAPNLAPYTNRGQALPSLKSRQFEVGIKHAGENADASIALFDIDRPQTADLGRCAAADSCTRGIDGSARHRGIEAQAKLHAAAWQWQASAMLLDAERRGSSQAGVNGQRPVNVPVATLRLGAEYRLASVPGAALLASLAAESDRVVLPYDTRVRIAGWSRWDLGARWRQEWDGSTLVWQVGLDNATNRRAWKESPYQFGHAYLFPLAPRTLRASLLATF